MSEKDNVNDKGGFGYPLLGERFRHLFRKNIEVYDGDWSNHYICPIGRIILIGAVVCFISTPFWAYYRMEGYSLAVTAVLYIIGSWIGKDGENVA